MSDAASVLARWWREFDVTGQLPPELSPVQTRLIRSVHRGDAGDGEVYIKVMTFPRGKDRLRYTFRGLPARHEANMLRHTTAAGIPCPEVVDVRVGRRFLLPHRSWLVTRALAVAKDAAAPSLADQAEVASALLAAGIVHRDLHAENFVRLADGRLAVLDFQSARFEGRACLDAGHRLAAAARLVRDVPARAGELLATDLVVDEAELALVLGRADDERAAYRRRRVMRCFAETTEFTRRIRWRGTEYRHRAPCPPGRWIAGGRELRDAWIGQRALSLFGSRSPLFWAILQKWWWLGGGCALYVPQTCSEERTESEIGLARRGIATLDERTQPEGSEEDGVEREPGESVRRGGG